MHSSIIILGTLACVFGGALAGTARLPSMLTEDRLDFLGDPQEFFVKWGPMGYFNQFYDPSNAIGPEILKGFGAPFHAHNGFNLMRTITAPPLDIPIDETTPYPREQYRRQPQSYFQNRQLPKMQSRSGTILQPKESLYFTQN